jgi:serine/threonine protein kinase/Tfp pilus assembly protein PilF
MSADSRLDQLLSQWQERHAQGEDMAATQLCRDCPELAPEVERRLAALRQMQHLLDTRDPLARSVPAPPGQSQPAGPLPAVAGYEILGELGRGGMGVVYKARHLALNRLVALKMILAGVHAGPEQRRRFRAEAEAVARLKHPNVVQIYEVGEHQGLPFLALEFVDGGSLDRRLNGSPLPPPKAAALLETLARAVHAAHAAGIVHRDLKPGNVLLEQAGVGAADLGTPKVTDFGLAKDLDAATVTTEAVVGTPTYMAPEQAAGRSRDIGPPSDLHALGAILYETLTGRPPFRGASVADTLVQVRTQEPVPPSRLTPTVPCDLETIALKCLQKEPAKRYVSAAALADDLRRFLDDRPILARPVGQAERLRRWCRRNPVVAGLSAALLLALLGGLCGMALLWRQAEASAEDARHQQAAAEEQSRAASAEADNADKFAGVLAEMFRSSDPLGLDAIPTVRARPEENRLAREILDRGAERVTAELSGDPGRQARLLDTIGGVYCTLGETAKAAPLLERALALRRQALPPDDPDLAASLHSLAWLNHQKGDYGKAEALYREALALRRRRADADPLPLSTTLMCLGWLRTDLEDYAAAEEMFKEAVALRLHALEENHRDVAVARVALAAAYIAEGKLMAAVAPYAQAKATLTKEADPALAESIDLFQQAMMVRGLVPSVAEGNLKKSLGLARQTLGEYHPFVALVLHELAFTLAEQKKDEEAERYYRDCLHIVRKYGLEHPKATILLRNFCRLLQRRGKLAEAEQLLQEALEARRTRYGPNHYLMADCLLVHAEVLEGQAERSRREQLLRQALAVYRQPAGPVPRGRLAVCLYRLADDLDTGHAAEAEGLLREALPLARKDLGEQAPLAGWVLCNLASFLMDQDKVEGVEESLHEALAIFRQAQSPAADVRWARQCLSRCYLVAGQPVKAADATLEERDLAGGDPSRLYDAAAGLGRCVARLGEGTPERAKYADLAMETLRQAAAKGFKDTQRLKNDKALDPLRERPEFGQLLQGLQNATGPNPTSLPP